MSLICPECHSEIEYKKNCNQCGWEYGEKLEFPLYFNKRDLQSNTFQKYLDNYDQIADDDLESSMQDLNYIKAQTNKIFSYIPNLKGKIVAELGIGQGNLFRKMSQSGVKHLYGVDIAISYLKQLVGLKNTHIVLANAENLPFKDELDIVVATDILEHVLNPGDFLVSINRALKVDGLCVIRVPFHENLITYSRQKGCPYEFVHLRTYNKQLLKSDFKFAGFKPIGFEYDGYLRDNLRKFWGPLSPIISSIVDWIWKEPTDIYKVNNFIGRLFFKPVEITIIAKKVKDI